MIGRHGKVPIIVYVMFELKYRRQGLLRNPEIVKQNLPPITVRCDLFPP
jgi:hypothetical protein